MKVILHKLSIAITIIIIPVLLKIYNPPIFVWGIELVFICILFMILVNLIVNEEE